MKPGRFRTIEGVIELKFGNDDGDIIATKQEQIDYLKLEKFHDSDINEYMNMWEWDEDGKCIGEK